MSGNRRHESKINWLINLAYLFWSQTEYRQRKQPPGDLENDRRRSINSRIDSPGLGHMSHHRVSRQTIE